MHRPHNGRFKISDAPPSDASFQPIGNFIPSNMFTVVSQRKKKLTYLNALAGNTRTAQPLIDSGLLTWTWIIYCLLVAGNAALIVVIGLDVVGIGPGLPLLDIIAHFVLFVAFAALFIYAVIQLGKETVIGDRMGLTVVSFNASVYNFVMTFVFLSWILDNTSQHAEVDYSDNMKAYSSFIGISVWSVVWFFVVCAVTCVVLYARYLKRKVEETIDMALSVQNQHLEQLHDTSLGRIVSEINSQQNLPTVIQTTL